MSAISQMVSRSCHFHSLFLTRSAFVSRVKYATVMSIRRYNIFSNSESDEILRELKELKAAEEANNARHNQNVNDPLKSNFPSSGGPSVEAITRLRRTNRKPPDQSEVQDRFAKGLFLS